jgi:hypothetical protein
MEIMCHSYSHNPDPQDWREFVKETRVAGDEMKALGLQVYTWVTPGTWWGNYFSINSMDQFGQLPDLILRQSFSAYEANAVPFDAGFGRYLLPRAAQFGVKYVTGDFLSLESLLELTDLVIDEGSGTEILFHSKNIGKLGYLSEEDFEKYLDTLQAKAGAGVLTVLTPTQQLFAQPFGEP